MGEGLGIGEGVQVGEGLGEQQNKKDEQQQPFTFLPLEQYEPPGSTEDFVKAAGIDLDAIRKVVFREK